MRNSTTSMTTSLATRTAEIAMRHESQSDRVSALNLTGSDEAIEVAVLGSLLIDYTLYEPCASFFAHSDVFTKPINRLLFEQIKQLIDMNRVVEAQDVIPIAVKALNERVEDERELRKLPKVEKEQYLYYSNEARLTEYVLSLMDRQYDPTIESLKENAQRLYENWLSRKLYLLSVDLQTRISTDRTKTVYDHLNYASEVIDLVASSTRSERSDIASMQVDYLKNLHRRMSGEGDELYRSGFLEIDEKAPLSPTELFVLAARPGMGKTAMMLVMALAAAKSGKPVIFFSLEMGRDQLMNRFVQYLIGISSRDIAKGKITEAEFQQVESLVSNTLSNLGISIFDDVFSIEGMWRKVRGEQLYDGLILADYLQLAETNGKFYSKDLEIAEITKLSKRIATHHNSCFVWASQLSRDVEKRGGDKRPVMSDLLYSGAIERDANVVAMLYRAAYYSPEADEHEVDKESGEVIIRKNREGSVGTVHLRFSTGSWQSDYLHELFPELNLSPPKVKTGYGAEAEARITASVIMNQMEGEDIPF